MSSAGGGSKGGSKPKPTKRKRSEAGREGGEGGEGGEGETVVLDGRSVPEARAGGPGYESSGDELLPDEGDSGGGGPRKRPRGRSPSGHARKEGGEVEAEEQEEEEEEGEGDDDSDDGLKVRRPSSCRATLTLTRTWSHFELPL